MAKDNTTTKVHQRIQAIRACDSRCCVKKFLTFRGLFSKKKLLTSGKYLSPPPPMKRTRYRLELIDPCTESWNAMRPTTEGRFCQHCAKNVVDFTGLTDDQLLALLKESKGTLCGRVAETQLDRDLITRTESTFSARLFKAFAGLFLLASTRSAAQELIVKQPRALVTAPTAQEIFEAKKQHDSDYGLQTWVKGRVISAETKEPLAGANIVLRQTGAIAFADSSGNFKLLLPDSLTQKQNKFIILHPQIGQHTFLATLDKFPAVIELERNVPPRVMSTGGLAVVKRKWWQRKKKGCG
jgi:hypothetical protein